MSHALDFSLGRAAIAYNAANGVPWHGFGEAKPEGEKWDLDTWIEKAGLNWRVEKSPIVYPVPNLAFNPKEPEGENNPRMINKSYDNRALLYRSDTQAPLSIMSESHYTPMQPSDLFAGLWELTKGSGYEIDVAGALRDGKVIWALAKRVDEVGTIGNDVIKPYVLLLTSYDGTYARTGRLTSVRVVCQNTVSLSGYRDSATTAKQRNSSEFTLEKANLLFDKLGEFDKEFASYMEAMKAMSDIKLSPSMVDKFFAKLYAPEILTDEKDWKNSFINNDAKGVTTNQLNNVRTLRDIFFDSPGSTLPSAEGTLFGALNAVTFYHDHMARTKENKRWESTTLGAGNRKKDEAMKLAMELLAS